VNVKRPFSNFDDIYTAMHRPRNQAQLEKAMRTRHRYFLLALLVWITVICISGVWMYHHFFSAGQKPGDPLLKGPPQFVLLALIVALSAYLRQVRSASVDQRDKIAEGKSWNYPLEEPYAVFTHERMRILDSVASILTTASPFLILLFVVLSIRALLDAADRLSHCPWITDVLCVADFLILVWVLMAFVFLASAHFRTRIQDDRIRAVARDFEEEILGGIRSKEVKKAEREELLHRTACKLDKPNPVQTGLHP
jgi:hypothetical protein